MRNKITYVTYATGEKYLEAAVEIFETTKKFFDHSILYKRDDIDAVFYEKNSKILDSKKGAGYWLWKPYLILKAMEKINDGDIIFYLDLGDHLHTNIYDIVNKITIDNSGFFLVSGNFINKNWTKYDCFNLMDCTGEKYMETNQLEAGCCAFRKSDDVISFLKEWLFFCSNYQIISDDPSDKNDHHLNEHRYDQSILTNLKIKYGIKSVPISEISKYITYNKYF